VNGYSPHLGIVLALASGQHRLPATLSGRNTFAAGATLFGRLSSSGPSALSQQISAVVVPKKASEAHKKLPLSGRPSEEVRDGHLHGLPAMLGRRCRRA